MKPSTTPTLIQHFFTIALCLFAIAPYAQHHDHDHNHEHAEQSYTTTVDNKDLNWLPAPDFFPGCSFTILHGEITEPNLDFFFRIEPNTEVMNHTHNSPERMILITGELQVQYEGEEPVILKAGTYAYGPAGKPHTAKCLDSGPCVLFIAMVDPFDAVPIAKKK